MLRVSFCLSLSCVLYAQCCQCLWIVFVLCLVCPMLPVSLDSLSLFCVLYTQCCQFLWIVFVLCLVCPMLSVSLDCHACLMLPVSLFCHACPMLPVSLDGSFLIAPLVFSNVYSNQTSKQIFIITPPGLRQVHNVTVNEVTTIYFDI